MPRPTTRERLQRKQAAVTCKQITSLILDYLTAELHHGTASQFKAHLQICPDCVAFLNTYKKTVELTRSFLQDRILRFPRTRKSVLKY